MWICIFLFTVKWNVCFEYLLSLWAPFSPAVSSVYIIIVIKLEVVASVSPSLRWFYSKMKTRFVFSYHIWTDFLNKYYFTAYYSVVIVYIYFVNNTYFKCLFLSNKNILYQNRYLALAGLRLCRMSCFLWWVRGNCW